MKNDYDNHVMFLKVFIVFMIGIFVVLFNAFTGLGDSLVPIAYLVTTIPAIVLIFFMIDYFIKYFKNNKKQ